MMLVVLAHPGAEADVGSLPQAAASTSEPETNGVKSGW
jgi:hypothetical protein